MEQTKRNTNKTKTSLKNELLQRFQNPLQARLILTGIMLAFGYMGIYGPFSEAIAADKQILKSEQDRLELSYELEILRARYDNYKDRLTENADTNEWVQYVLGGIQQFPLTLDSLDPGETRKVGPFKAVELKIQVIGRFRDLHRLLHWFESNERLFRVDFFKTDPTRSDEDSLTMSMTVLGMSH